MASPTVGTKRSFAAMNDHRPSANMSCHLGSRSPFQVSGHSSSRSAPGSRRSSDVSVGFDNGGSRHQSPRPTTTPFRPIVHPRRTFVPSASILIVGMRGSGKSTLAVIASTALHRRVIDTDHVFHERTGQSSTAYRKAFGTAQHHERQLEVLRSVLDAHSRNAVLVCSSASVDNDTQELLRRFAEDHPVIHVVREASSIQRYLNIKDDSRFANLMSIGSNAFRTCSNFEFYNISEVSSMYQGNRTEDRSHSRNGSKASPPFLTLKKAERHFLKFITLVLSRGSIAPFEAAYPLSQVPLMDRQFTYAASVDLDDVIGHRADIDDIEVGADAIELIINNAAEPIDGPLSGTPRSPQFGPARADAISAGLARVRRSVILPLVCHVDIASFDGNWHLYVAYLKHALRLAPDFLTVSLDLDDEIISELRDECGSTKLLAHYVDSQNDSPGWEEQVWAQRLGRAQRLECSAVRLHRVAQDQEDNYTLESFKSRMRAHHSPHIPIIAYNLGQAGRLSACLNRTLTSVKATSADEGRNDTTAGASVTAPLLTARHATEALYKTFICDPMKFYIIGGSAGYSLSPAMHNASYKMCGMPHTYQTHQTPSLNSIREVVEDHHFGGASVSLPFKVAIIALTHSLSRHAKAIGAVNTIIPVRRLGPDGSLPDQVSMFRERNRAGPVKAFYGENTDWIGIRACIRRGLSPANAVRPRSCGLVIGAGGMARAAIYAMLQLGVRNVVIYNRTRENAARVVDHYTKLLQADQTFDQTNTIGALSDSSIPVTFEIIDSVETAWPANLRSPTIIVSCIPTHAIGNSPAPDFSFPAHWLQSPTGGVVVEIAYKTLRTPLMEQIRALALKGWVAMDGLDLLPEQAFAQFELFTGRRAPRRLMRAEVLRSYGGEEGEANQDMLQARLRQIDEHEL